MNKMLWKKEIIALVVLALIFLVAIGAMVYKHHEHLEKQKMFTGSTKGKLTSLLDQRMNLQKEIDDISDQMAYADYGPLIVLFSQPMDKLDKKAIPAMQNHNHVGVIAISEHYFPGEKNCLSVMRLKTLQASGWEIVLNCTRNTDIEALYKKVKDAGLGTPVALYYGSRNAKPDFEVMSKLNIDTVIRYNVMPDYFRGAENREIESIFAYGCNDTGRSKKRKDLMEKGECFAYVVGYSNNREYCSNMDEWVKELDKAMYEEGYKVTSITGAKAILQQNRENLEKNNKELYQKREKYINQMENINNQIKASKEEYGDEN